MLNHSVIVIICISINYSNIWCHPSHDKAEWCLELLILGNYSVALDFCFWLGLFLNSDTGKCV